MVPYRTHPQALSELSDVTVMPLLIVRHGDWEK